MTVEQLKVIAHKGSVDKLKLYLPFLNDTMVHFNIDSPNRMSAFIARIAHESGQFNYVTEIASGSAYEGRKDLGNNIVGDGVKFKGLGLIQITGRANCELCSTALTGNSRTFVDRPELLATPQYACLSAGWYWSSRRLNDLANKDDF